MVSNEHPVVLIGAGGHAAVCLELLMRQKASLLGYVSSDPSEDMHPHLAYLGNDEKLAQYKPDEIRLVMGIGFVVGSDLRERLYRHYRKMGFRFKTMIHESAVIALNAKLEEGAQVMAGAVIQARAVIGENALVNTRASVDHDSIVESHAAIMPGVTICGGVRIGEGSFIGAGATIIQQVVIGNRTVLGAGALALKSLPVGSYAYGVPAKEGKEEKDEKDENDI